MKKKLTALLLVLLLLVSTIQVSAAPAVKSLQISSASATMIGCPPVAGMSADLFPAFDFGGPDGFMLETPEDTGIPNSGGWWQAMGGTLERVDTFTEGMSYYFQTVIRMESEAASNYQFSKNFVFTLKDQNGQTLPTRIVDGPYNNDAHLGNYFVVMIGPMRAAAEGTMPLRTVHMTLDAPLSVVGGAAVTSPAFTIGTPNVTFDPSSSGWYRYVAYDPKPCDPDHRFIPGERYFYSAAFTINDPHLVTAPLDQMYVHMGDADWEVSESTQNTFRAISPEIVAEDHRAHLKAVDVSIPNLFLRDGQGIYTPKATTEADVCVSYINAKWYRLEPGRDEYIYTPPFYEADARCSYVIELMLVLDQSQGLTHTFAPDCVFRVNGRVCETEIDGSVGTPVCLATVSVPVVPQDEPLVLLRRPDQRVYAPGEHFNPAGLEIGFLTDGIRTAVSDLTFDSEAIQANQETVRVQWDGMYVDVPIIVAQGSPFADVAAGSYAYDPAIWAHHDGIASGVSAGLFAPGRTCTRGQMVTFLWRFAGCPKPTGSENPFTDVRPGSYYSDAVRWAVEQGITTGTGSDSFSPEKTCTRGQMVTFLWRFAGRPVPTSGESPFTDVRPGSYCSEAVRWAMEQGITTGVDASHFGPERSCTRGHAVTFLYRM